MTQLPSLNTTDIIGARDVAAKIPSLLRKLPNILRGLRHVYDTRHGRHTGLGWAFERAVRLNPNGLALQYRDESYTYEQFNAWANQIAHLYLSAGLAKGDVVALAIENRPELLANVIACAKTGCIAALINTAQTGKVLTHSINLVAPKMLIVGEEMREVIERVRDDLDLKSQWYWVADQDQPENNKLPKGFSDLKSEIANLPAFNPPTSTQVYFEDPMFYMYTSGTTGLPKAVIFNHGRWMRTYGSFGHIMNLGKDDVLYCTLPLYHGTAMVVCWSCVLAGAGTFAIRRKFSRTEFWSDCRRYQATAFGYVGELCRYLMDSPPSEQDRQHRVTKMIGNGLRPNVWVPFKQRFGIKDVLEIYGSSEGNVGFTNLFNFDNTLGYCPLPYAIVKYDQETGQPIRDDKGYCIPVQKGEVGLLLGEITKRSPFEGYTDPEKNRQVIMENVLKQGDRYFNTGDLIRHLGFKHGQFVDRTGDTFRWKGENVSTTEVENIISMHPQISEAVVYGVEIPGTNGRAGMAAVTLYEGIEPELHTWPNAFRESLPGYAVPLFIRLQQQIEATGTFKYQKVTLKKQAFNPAETDEPLYVLLPGTDCYVPVDETVYQNICNGTYRF